MNDGDAELFCNTLLKMKSSVAKCKSCFNLVEGSELCFVCSDSNRDRGRICVVEAWTDLIAIERTGIYDGLYHVLGGVLSPIDGIGVEDLTISALVDRVKKDILTVSELIIATNQTPEGEATASYISSLLENLSGLKISRLATGMPIGSSISQMDTMTIQNAISMRRPF
jgi:recombination protein RecR